MSGADLKPPPTGSAPTEAAIPGVDRIMLVASGLGAVLSAAYLGGWWSVYRSAPIVVALWVVSAAVVPALVWSVRRAGRLTNRAFGGVLVVLLVLDLGVPAMVPIELWYQSAAWNWGGVSLILFTLAGYRSVREVTAVTLVHGALGVAQAPFLPAVDPVDIIQFVMGTLIPPLAAAHYLSLYVAGLKARALAVERHRTGVAAAAAEQQARRLVDERLAAVRPQLLALLDDVAAGRAVPLRDVDRARAERLARLVRRELDESLVAARSLLPRGTTSSPGLASSEEPDLDVLGSPGLLPLPDRLTLAAVVEVLAGTPGCRRITVTVLPADPPERADHEGAAPVDRVEVVLVAAGAETPETAEAVRVLLAGWTAAVTLEDGDLVMEGERDKAREDGHSAARSAKIAS